MLDRKRRDALDDRARAPAPLDEVAVFVAVARLEDRIGVRLLACSTRSVGVTEDGALDTLAEDVSEALVVAGRGVVA